MELIDRYMLTSNSSVAQIPEGKILPSADLSSLWFKSLFEWFNKATYGDPDIGVAAMAVCLFLFGVPFILRLGAQAGVYGQEWYSEDTSSQDSDA